MKPAGRIQLLAEFGVRVREARIRQRLSQEELAALAGVHRTYIGTVERGERNPALVNIVRISDALDIDPSALVKGLSARAQRGRAGR